MRCTLIGALAAAFLVAALVERAESHFTFFSPKEMREMMERGRAGKKSVDLEPRSEEGQFEEVAIPERSEEVGGSQVRLFLIRWLGPCDNSLTAQGGRKTLGNN
ncbi:uncharacterized protein mlnl isoform X2 [Anguilla anguilla]|uniref:uncharacterized protein mlnl isoform X2 n=1 Tax=Anguilla anguilla TaxID=7936 RepID=UPI0015A8543D|nr:uncharacterized protein mlnl isoform X2 [Anguilla anguilla]